MVEFVDSEESSMPTYDERIIWKLYKWGAMVIPLVIMLSHWYIFYVFSQNTHEVLDYPEANTVCIAWIYACLYLGMPLIFLPATYLYRRCDLFRIPFVYFIFINVERWYYDSYFCTNEMVDSHYLLIYCTLCIYAMELLGLWWRHRHELTLYNIVGKIKRSFPRKDGDGEYEEIVRIMEEREHGAS